MAKSQTTRNFLLCVMSKDCEDLEKGKVYPVLPDARAKRDGYVRVIDESGEDYLYPESCFVTIDLPARVREALSSAS